ncbi:ABC transporter substrate-binding protein [Sediminivirga luteola]|uniref:Peptide ABC transporter substrate-binding protein n=1 Tax=Sediminivirga luteola TaxID=1774748 RepID=A0A8J2TYF9_9MICO|nr:ABC transporter substrate-binding protein [Sediminivirga luteola]MCI2264790.1 ABC transporter substrate-binding protein [Sediminivirga luteola]GGA16418.1 peptide ABC transporter substrate-binding protein [Sediminivirga luteola]
MMTKRSIAALVAAGALTLSACGSGSGAGSSESSGEPVIDGTLSYAINEDPGNLFRHVNSSATLSYVYPWAYESPVYFDQNGEAQGWLAEDWEETPTSLQFTIREGAMCSDGTEMTAETVANNYRWILDPDNGSTFVGLVVPADAQVEHDEAARTVTLTTENPNSFLLPQLGIHPIYCQGALDDPDSVASTTNGTGLYQMTEAVPGDHYTLERRDDYAWAPEGGPDGSTEGVPKNVQIRIIENPSTRANLLLSGELNMAAVQGPDEDRVAASVDPLIESRLVTGGFAYSQAEGQPTADEDVRVALTKALDLDSLMQVQTAGKGERAQRLAVLDPQICQYDAATPNLPATDVADAEAMLDEAGWVQGSDGIRAKDGEELVLEFAWNTRWPENSAAAELMAEQWAAIGVGVNHHGTDANAFLERVTTEGASSELDVIWLASNYSVPNVLASFVSGPTPPQGNNYAGVSNPDFDEIVAESSSLTGAEACGSWEQAESAMYAAADYVPFAMRPDITYGQGLDAMITPNGTMFTGLILVED